MDPLSEVLSLLSNRNSFFGGLKAGGDWAIRFPAPEGVKFNAVVHGSCWLAEENAGPPIKLEAGDCFLLSGSRPVLVGSDLSRAPLASEEIFRETVGNIARYGETDDAFLIGGSFIFGDDAKLLFDSLPAVVVVKSASDQAAMLRWALQRLAHELSCPSPGNVLMSQHLGHIMLIQALRVHLEQEDSGAPNWLSALSAPRIGVAIQAIHAAPAHRWTVDAIAEIAGVSRSTLALRFKQVVGLAPLEYVLHWRIQLAMRALRQDHITISKIAQMLGYESDSAFSSAFKRVTNYSPSDYRNRQTATSMIN